MLSGDGTPCQDDTVESFEEQCAHRPKLTAHDAIRRIRGLLQRVDTDLSSCIDTIPNRELMKSIAWRVNDAAMMGLIEAWLEIAIERAPPKNIYGRFLGLSNHASIFDGSLSDRAAEKPSKQTCARSHQRIAT